MQDKDNECTAEIYAVIGKAVAELIKSGEDVGKKNVLLKLQLHSTLTTDTSLQAVYNQAFRNILESFH
ncbi:hypothetical protein [Erwinia sp. E_sp_B04_7]|uniref:hypothetical protein n=1 Tax=unclassified Erwinia TaxID=2622719 RepID=UPI0030CBEA46